MGFGDLLDRRPAELTVGIRPLYIKEGKSKYTIAGKVEGIEPLGGNILVHVTINEKIKITHLTTKKC